MLEQAEHEWLACPHALAAIRLLVLTGCRSAEVLKPSWDDVHLERRCLRLPASKARRRTVLLNEPALEVLCGIEQKDDNPHVILGYELGSHCNSLQTPWERIREAAEIPDFRIHDLRHTFTSFGVDGGHAGPLASA